MAPPPTLQELIDIVRQDASSDQPLDQLVAASATAANLQETTDALLGYFVDRCRRDGRSWTEISSALGVTKQAVHKRFSSAIADHLVAVTPSPTFERFTDRARHVVARSRQVAIELAAPAVGTEHILLALFVEPEGLAARALAAMEVSEDTVLAAIRTRTDRGELAAAGPHEQPVTPAEASATQPSATQPSATQPSATQPSADEPSAAVKYSDEARRALRDVLAVALEFSHNYIGTEHMLLGLYRNEESAAARILAECGARQEVARAHIVDMIRTVS
jgi:ATP-dependent Clp protease ATP-binding subunit ClpA